MIAIDQRCIPAGDREIERIHKARWKLRQVRQILMTPSPEGLSECGTVLEEAAELLGKLQPGPTQRVPHLMDELQVLRRELTVVNALMQQAAGYYLGWAQILGAATGGYTSHGEAAPLTVRRAGVSRLSMEV